MSLRCVGLKQVPAHHSPGSETDSLASVGDQTMAAGVVSPASITSQVSALTDRQKNTTTQ